jgi:hypothetical protein
MGTPKTPENLLFVKVNHFYSNTLGTQSDYQQVYFASQQTVSTADEKSR